MISGLFVAPMMKTFFLAPIPSISVKNLIDNSISCSTSITNGSPSRFGNGIQFIKEQNARSCRSGLVKNVPYICLGFSKPHGKQFGSLNTDKIGLTFVGNCFGEQSFTTSRRSIEQNSSTWLHSKL